MMKSIDKLINLDQTKLHNVPLSPTYVGQKITMYI